MEGVLWILNLSTGRVHAGSLAMHYELSCTPGTVLIQGAIGCRRGGGVQAVQALSTQREQLWAVDKAARGEGATLQAMAATRRPTQREQL